MRHCMRCVQIQPFWSHEPEAPFLLAVCINLLKGLTGEVLCNPMAVEF